MKQLGMLLILMSCTVLAALPVNHDNTAKIQSGIFQDAGSLSMLVSNYGFVENLTFPRSSTYLLYDGAMWISGKRYRRNSNGDLLFWLSSTPWAGNDTLVVQTDPRWHPGLHPAVDTLTTVGFDGDQDLMELLPAYNQLSTALNPSLDLNYNSLDVVMKSILGNPAPRPFAIPDPTGTYCFSIPSPTPFDPPGFETLSGYFYDYCPFGTPGERDVGASHSASNHYPLGLAVHRESYAWPLEDHDQMVIFRNTLYNASEIDTLFDLTVAEYVDCDVRPVYYGSEGAMDDVSGFVKGTGYEFAYTRDQDGDNGQCSTIMGHKLILPGFTGNRQAWYWRVGQGPDDRDPRELHPTGNTSNEKYWLCTGRNANSSYYLPLRPTSPDIMEYEQPSAADTRFLSTLYGSQPTASNPNPQGRLYLPPHGTLVYYSVYFTGNSLEELKNRSQFIDGFIGGGMNLGNITGLSCIPYLLEPQVVYPAQINLQWQSYTDPDQFQVLYKEYDSPATTWVTLNVPGSSRAYALNAMDPNRWYEIKVASIYNAGPNEVYLESGTKLININNSLDASDPIQPPELRIKAFPNPFSTRVAFQWQQIKPGSVRMDIYNLRGQLVRTLLECDLPAGDQQCAWDGKTASGQNCGSGIYFARLRGANSLAIQKLLLVR